MPISRPRVFNRHLAGVLLGAVVLIAVASAWQLAQSQSDSRGALRDRFADRAPVTTAVVDGLFRSIFTGQAEALQAAFSRPRVGRASLDAWARRNKNTFVMVTDARGRVLGSSTTAPARWPGLRLVERTALRSGYGLSDVRPGQPRSIVAVVRFNTATGPRTLVSGSPEKAYAKFLETTLRPVVGSADGGAFLLDGEGTAIGAVGGSPAMVDHLRHEPSTRRRGMVGSPAGTQFFATSPVGGSRWRTALTVPTATLYGPADGLGRWLPWAILALLIATLLAGVALVRRLIDTGARLTGTNAELESANQNLARSNADLEQFAYIASHDLSSPLRSVSGFSQMLSTRYRGRLDDDADEWITFIDKGVTRMQRIIDDLLRYSRVNQDEQHPDPVDLEEVLEDLARSLEPMLDERDAELTSDPLPVVLGEATHLSQVLQNLIVNAATYVKPGVAPQIHVGAELRGGMCRLSVSDNGIGIDPQHADRVFKMFQRLHSEEEHPGSGIGLAISKKIVERHGGRLEVSPAPGGGTTFAFSLPLASQSTAVRVKVLQ